ncbi:MAG: hypothetical protein JNL07_04965 [Rhodospirillales bacterium]|nr:hypothetical protein [Rhodospirillales bacterium]
MLDRTQTSPSLAVLCGGSEVAQQAAMLGLPKATWGGPLFDAILPEVARTWRPDVPYVPNSPSGGDLPFSTGAGVTHYYGVGAYRRPLEDARRAEVRFASECLAFANVPEAATLAAAGVAAPGDAAWKAAVPRDGGADWDFDDVRDHYLTTLYGAVPTALRRSEPDRYLRLSRAITGEVIEATIAEWRRPASSCGGALLWMLQDLRPGAGWGVVDSLGVPKAAWHALRRACRPVQLAMTDEGLDGLALHLTNETPAAIAATLSVVCLRDGAVPVRRARRDVALPARSARTISSADLIGAFFDVTYAYRFGAPQHDAVVATLADAATGAVLAEAFHFPMGRAETPVELGLAASIAPRDGGWALRLSTARLARSIHVDDANFRAAEEFFHLAPGVERIVPLVARVGAGAGATPAGEIHALNAASPLVYGRSS